MGNKELQNIGSELDVSSLDITRIRKEKIKENIIYPVMWIVVAILSLIVGSFMGGSNPITICDNCCPTYPACFASVGGTLKKDKKYILISALVAFLVSSIGFVYAYKTSQPVFHVAMLYNVYKR